MPSVITLVDLSDIIPISVNEVRDGEGYLVEVTNAYTFCQAKTTFTRSGTGRIQTVSMEVFAA